MSATCGKKTCQWLAIVLGIKTKCFILASTVCKERAPTYLGLQGGSCSLHSFLFMMRQELPSKPQGVCTCFPLSLEVSALESQHVWLLLLSGGSVNESLLRGASSDHLLQDNRPLPGHTLLCHYHPRSCALVKRVCLAH